jgi:hypothetical protein
MTKKIKKYRIKNYEGKLEATCSTKKSKETYIKIVGDCMVGGLSAFHIVVRSFTRRETFFKYSWVISYYGM